MVVRLTAAAGALGGPRCFPEVAASVPYRVFVLRHGMVRSQIGHESGRDCRQVELPRAKGGQSRYRWP